MNTSEIKVVLNKEIEAPVAKVFQAWTRPELIMKWFAPGSVMTVPSAEVSLKAGGEYLIHMYNPETKEDHIVGGCYKEVIQDEKLVFSWKWKEGTDTTWVTIDLQENGPGKTMLTLTHAGFSQQEFAQKHTMGWNGCLANLEGMFSPISA
jgi:uncharacterized protein YndB with AHSA1/START domain